MRTPNIVHLFFDEMRCDALSCYPDAPKGIRTPCMDKIAESGVRFDECYCNSPVCVPSRYSMMTGLYPETTGVYHNEASWKGYEMEKTYLTIPEVLAENGYVTANFGKMHLPQKVFPFQHHDPSGSEPPISEEWRSGADVFHAKGLTAPIGGIYPKELSYPPEKVTENGIAWMKEQTEPFFVRLSYLQPHTPVVVPEPFASMYDGMEFLEWQDEDAELSKFERAFVKAVDSSNLTNRQRYLAKVRYYGLVAWLDEQVGCVMEFLEQSGLRKNTIVVLGADHGAMLGENGRYGKQNFCVHSHRVPLLISWPDVIPDHVVKKNLCENISLGKTLFRLLEIPCPRQFQGLDLLGREEAESIFSSIGYGEKDSYTFPNKKWGDYGDSHGWPRRACVRSGPYRFDMNIRLDGKAVKEEDEDMFFTDRRKDPKEQHNMAELPEYRDIVKLLRKILLDHIEREERRGQETLC